MPLATVAFLVLLLPLPEQIEATDHQQPVAHLERSFGRITAELQGLGRTTALDGEDFNSRPPAVTTENIDADQAESVLRGVLRFKRDETLTLETFAEGAFNTTSNSSRGTVNGAPRTAPGFDIEERRGENAAAEAVEAWPEPLGEEVVGPAGCLVGRLRPLVRRAEADQGRTRGEQEADHEQEGHPRRDLP